jgi:hypothetical protein
VESAETHKHLAADFGFGFGAGRVGSGAASPFNPTRPDPFHSLVPYIYGTVQAPK